MVLRNQKKPEGLISKIAYVAIPVIAVAAGFVGSYFIGKCEGYKEAQKDYRPVLEELYEIMVENTNPIESDPEVDKIVKQNEAIEKMTGAYQEALSGNYFSETEKREHEEFKRRVEEQKRELEEIRKSKRKLETRLRR